MIQNKEIIRYYFPDSKNSHENAIVTCDDPQIFVSVAQNGMYCWSTCLMKRYYDNVII